jgi:uncharacterized protein (TIGR00375 family)
LRVFWDAHIHSKYSRATSASMEIPEICRYAQMKGLNLVGSGDFTHPRWLAELKSSLMEVPETDLYMPTGTANPSVHIMITGEVSTIFEHEGVTRKIHHVILTPSLEIAEINDRLSKHGDLSVDGRPTLNILASELVEEVVALSDRNEVFPAHCWTPWFSIFGANSGFDRVEDCYQDMTKHIHALETGLSSDPPMNWRLSSLDRYTLVSNSDSHSPYPYRMGREANVLDLDRLTYDSVIDAVRRKDPKLFKYTIETDPSYGKYHWTGHRSCNVSMSAGEAVKLGGRCPACHRKMTKGVEERVEELADRPAGFRPDNAIGYVHLLPLQEIIATVVGSENPSAPKVWQAYDVLVTRLGSEYSILLDVSREELTKVAGPEVAEAVVRVRDGAVRVIPGYDGVYGRLVLFPELEEERSRREVRGKRQPSLDRFM